LNREIYDALDEYARAFDDWCDSQGDLKKAMGDKDFGSHFEKRKKFDTMTDDMPKDLKSPIDKLYLQKILRRARQNRHKREQTLARQAAKSNDDKSVKAESEEEDASVEKPKPKRKPASKPITFIVPELVTEFPTRVFNPKHF
jgi:hypothetical protein